MNDSSVSAPARVQSTDSPVMGGLLLRSLGSLYFAAVLLMLWLVGMACATVYESTHSASRALAEFYTTPWFKGLLVLLAMNVAASMVARYPFSKRQLGFVITHGGILVTLGGALITDRLAVNGNVQFFERDTVDEFSTPGDVLTLSPAGEPARFATVDLDARGFGGFAEFDEPAAPPLELDDLRAEIVRYLPDSRRVRRVQDDGHQPQTAVEISLSAADGQGAAWLFADQPRKVGGVNAVLRTAADPQKLDALLSPQTTDPEADPGSVRIELEGHPYEIPLPECLDHPVPLGDTQTSVHVLEYLPHAVVGADNRLVSASDRPENPAIVVKISGPQGQETHKAFANFPDFHAMHGKSQLEGLKLTFSAPAAAPPDTDLVIISGPDGGLHARFSPQGGVPATHRLEMGQPIDTPWSPNRLAVLRRFEHARMAEVVEPVVPCGKERHQALLVSISRGEHSFETWVQKHIPRQVAFEGGAYKLVYGSKRLPLGFNLTLDKFHLGVYPGSRRPRSFESHVTVLDPATGQTRSRVISMNRPLEHGGYTLYQSSYRKGRGRTSSVLSVAKDPGKPVVFVGYVVTLLGMFIVLGIRLVDQRKVARVAVASS